MAREHPLVVCGTKSVPWSILVNSWKVVAKEVSSELKMVNPKVQGGETSTTTEMSKRENDPEDGSDDDKDVKLLAMIKIDVLDNLVKVRRSQGGERVRKFLMISRTSEATDPRDRVYA